MTTAKSANVVALHTTRPIYFFLLLPPIIVKKTPPPTITTATTIIKAENPSIACLPIVSVQARDLPEQEADDNGNHTAEQHK